MSNTDPVAEAVASAMEAASRNGATEVAPIETAPVQEVAPEAQPLEQAPAKAQPLLLKVHGKEFDVSTELGRLQHQAWSEAISSVVGRQGEELGKLRKFAAARKPTADEQKLIAQAKAKAAEGDLDTAFESVLDYAKDAVSQVESKFETERKNSALWDEYFTDRTDLAKKLGRDKVKKIAENALDLYAENQDVFKTLDDFFLPLISSVAPQAGQKPANSEKPPVTLSGSAKTPSAPAKNAPATTQSFTELLDSRSLGRKR